MMQRYLIRLCVMIFVRWQAANLVTITFRPIRVNRDSPGCQLHIAIETPSTDETTSDQY